MSQLAEAKLLVLYKLEYSDCDENEEDEEMQARWKMYCLLPHLKIVDHNNKVSKNK